MPSQEVLLTVPAQPEFLRVARVTASGLASRLGFNIDDVDDLRLALDELCFALIADAENGDQLTLRYIMREGDLVIEGATRWHAARPVNLGPLSQQILTALVDEHHLWDDDGQSSHFSLTKRQSVPPR